MGEPGIDAAVQPPAGRCADRRSRVAAGGCGRNSPLWLRQYASAAFPRFRAPCRDHRNRRGRHPSPVRGAWPPGRSVPARLHPGQGAAGIRGGRFGPGRAAAFRRRRAGSSGYRAAARAARIDGSSGNMWRSSAFDRMLRADPGNPVLLAHYATVLIDNGKLRLARNVLDY